MKFYVVAETEEQTTKLLELKGGSFKMCDVLEGLLMNWNSFTREQIIEIGKALEKAEDQALLAISLYLNSVEKCLNKIGTSLVDKEKRMTRDFEHVLEDIVAFAEQNVKRNTNDEVRSFEEVLEDIGKQWDNFTSIEQHAIANVFAGVRQDENSLVMMGNHGNSMQREDGE